MKIIAKESENKKLSSNVLTIAAEARAAKDRNPKTIDGTVGTLFDDNGKILEFNTVNQIINNLTYSEKYAYASTSGGKDFKECIAKWVLGKTYNDITSNMYYEVIATPGGSGAIGSSIANYLNRGDKVLIPNVCWGPYNSMSKERGCGVEHYDMFKDGKFNLCEFSSLAKKEAQEQNRVLAIINDPCHNPTGYSLDDNEWDEIIKVIKDISIETPFILVYDMAYIDYSHRGIDGAREVFKKFQQFNENVMVIFCFSGSKTFSLYGLRIGAEMCLTKNKDEAERFYNASEFSARSCWSNTAKMGISLVCKLFSKQEYIDSFMEEIKDAAHLLHSRADLFLKEAKEEGVPTYPYKSGFFITIPCDGQKVYDNLREKDIFVVPLKEGIRISLSALSLTDLKGLAKKIKNEL